MIINKAYKSRIYPNQAQAIPEDLMKHL
ncbi:helix-turn-helix domain-containing protein [Bacillus cereus]|nr:helix-turn-helix domain-containing protein [Bacillus thuringiensis]MDA2068422.1 helix-turn-helix domain-containing protein [Bacillus cereus]MDA2080162.1 helix-turn-helix domain-containing protein [Bacillus cereus]MDA2085687.1 helix-turn-helix domain-containing protein [Bacillus cereus]